MKCRHCANRLYHTLLDLGIAPPSNAFLDFGSLEKSENVFPLKVRVCTECWLVQTEDYSRPDELFTADYPYFSSTSSGWLKHASDYANGVIERFNLNKTSLVLEVASNDGYLLKNFIPAGVPCLGIEPTESTASAAEKIGVPVLREFFGYDLGKRLVREGRQADLIVGNNVYAHVPDINDFTMGIKTALKPEGVVTLEFPQLMQLLKNNQFDTIYHEHYSYLSLNTVEKIFRSVGLRIWDAEKLPTHGGSLRVYGCHLESARLISSNMTALMSEELDFGIQDLTVYKKLQLSADKIKKDLLCFLNEQKLAGKRVVAYGAAAKGNTLLNYAGVKADLIPCIYDAAKSKQGKYMPGSHIPILSPEEIENNYPDYVLILPWNISEEIIRENFNLVERGVKFLAAIPDFKILN